jgi:hypothetical protein
MRRLPTALGEKAHDAIKVASAFAAHGSSILPAASKPKSRVKSKSQDSENF